MRTYDRVLTAGDVLAGGVFATCTDTDGSTLPHAGTALHPARAARRRRRIGARVGSTPPTCSSRSGTSGPARVPERSPI
ncbi:hypothetical protein HBB16_07520 [Pseudonocardia sp. MCCB 268]|nr:hypothetical protein [Pseudonocardia cytotoxica]